MSTPSGGRAGHEHDRDDTDEDVAAAAPTGQREGEYTDSDTGPDDTDPPKGSYTARDVTP